MSWAKYPANWFKVSRKLRRKVRHCELCGLDYGVRKLTVHHRGAPRPTGDGWTSGNAHDKHDLRRDNLQVMCIYCHDAIDDLFAIRERNELQRQRREVRREQHRALGVGTGLVLYQEART